MYALAVKERQHRDAQESGRNTGFTNAEARILV
jgi:hypothetical protein